MTTPDRRTMQALLDRPLDELLEELDLYTPTRKGFGSAWDDVAAAVRQRVCVEWRWCELRQELSAISILLLDAGQMREAIEAVNEYVETQQRFGIPARQGIGHERQGQLAAALEKYQQALELARKYSPPQDVVIVERLIARMRGKMGYG